MKRILKVLTASVGLISVGAIAGAFLGRVDKVKTFLDGIHANITAKVG